MSARKKNFHELIFKVHSDKGFTLLELLVVFSLTALMAGGGFFAFTQYVRSQSFNQGVEQIRLTYEQARNFAISNVKPEDECSSDSNVSILRGYRVDLTQDSLVLVVGCSTGDSPTYINLPADVRLRNPGGDSPTACSGIEFEVITGNVRPTGGRTLPCEVEVYHEDDSNLVKSMTIAQDGRLSFNEISL